MKGCLQSVGPGPRSRTRQAHEEPRWGRGSEGAGQLPVLRIGQGRGLGAPLLVHGAQELLHIRGQQVIHLVALDRGRGLEAVRCSGSASLRPQGHPVQGGDRKQGSCC